jgi:hypothetical protein
MATYGRAVAPSFTGAGAAGASWTVSASIIAQQLSRR